MTNPDPTKEEYLAVVSEWIGYAQQSANQVGNAYPIFSLTRGEAVLDPLNEFPNPGYVFLVHRGELTFWDYVLVRPQENPRYKQHNPRECYYIAKGTPPVFGGTVADSRVAVVLDVPSFDPGTSDSLLRNPAQNVTPLFFVRTSREKLFGPLRRTQVVRGTTNVLEGIHWAPWRPDGVVYEFTEDSLTREGCKLFSYVHPEPDLNVVASEPIHLVVGPVASVTSGRALDHLSDAQLAEWYLRARDIAVAEDVLKKLREAGEHLAGASKEVVKQRFERLLRLVFTVETLQRERINLAHRYLESDEGRQILKQQIDREIERRAMEIEGEVKKRRHELAAEKQRLEVELQKLQQESRKKADFLQKEVKELEGRKSELEADLQGLQNEFGNNVDQLATELKGKVPLLAALTAGARSGGSVVVHSTDGGVVAPRGRSPWTAAPAPAPTRDLTELRDESALVDQLVEALAGEDLCFTRDFLANLYVLLKSSSLNLIMGPPGYGKSSVVAALARALGHGNALLEIAVRRSWSDDRYLLGFFDAFHGRFDPGPTGLATRLLTAQRDWERERRGIYLVLLDEFNLAAPEYYFSQLLQTLTRPPEQPRVVPLFDPTSLPPGETERTDSITLYPNVRFWGTINYDETTERLSPRLLDRTGMVFLGARDVVPSVATAEAPPPAPAEMKGVRAGQVFEAFTRRADQCPDELWELIAPLLDLLKRQTDEWGSEAEVSPRVLDGVKRYLANAAGLLSPQRAVDFAFQQRILPILRGRGPRFAARVKALEEKLTEKGLERSARHVRNALALADATFGDIDFLAYS
jgi:hypothetical protein